MKLKISYLTAVALTGIGLAGTPALASGSSTPPPRPQPRPAPERYQVWSGSLSGGGTGTASFRQSGSDAWAQFSIRGAGLKPSTSYAFWLVDSSGQLQGMGPSPHQARTDEAGNLVYYGRIERLSGATVRIRVTEPDASTATLEGEASLR